MGARMRRRLLYKSFREQSKLLFGFAIIAAVRSAAKAHRYTPSSGGVEWWRVEQELRSWEEGLRRVANGWSGDTPPGDGGG